PRCRQTGGGENGLVRALDGSKLTDVGARLPRLRFTVAARGTSGAADNLVAAAGDAAGAAPHRLSGDPAAARAGAARGDAGADPPVADPAAHVAGRAGDSRGRTPAAQSAGAPGIDRSDRARRRRRLGGSARL